MKYEYNGSWYTPNELSEMSGISAHTIRDRLRRGYSVSEAVKVLPIRESVREFAEASWWKDWVGLSIDALYEIYFHWCISAGYEYIEISKQGFSRQLMSLYPNLKTIPTKKGDKCERIIRERS